MKRPNHGTGAAEGHQHPGILQGTPCAQKHTDKPRLRTPPTLRECPGLSSSFLSLQSTSRCSQAQQELPEMGFSTQNLDQHWQARRDVTWRGFFYSRGGDNFDQSVVTAYCSFFPLFRHSVGNFGSAVWFSGCIFCKTGCLTLPSEEFFMKLQSQQPVGWGKTEFGVLGFSKRGLGSLKGFNTVYDLLWTRRDMSWNF